LSYKYNNAGVKLTEYTFIIFWGGEMISSGIRWRSICLQADNDVTLGSHYHIKFRLSDMQGE